MLVACGGGGSGSSSHPTGLSTAEGTSQPTGQSTQEGTNPGLLTSQEEGEQLIKYEGATNINVWAPAEEKPVIVNVVNRYNASAKESDRVNVTLKTVSEADGGSALAKDPQQTDYPSLVAIADDQLADLVSKQYAAGLPNSFASAITTGDISMAVTAASVNEKLYAYPISADNGYFLWYDGDALNENQVADLESILSVCQQKGKSMLYDLGGWYVGGLFFSQGVAGPDSLRFHANEEGKNVYDITWDSEESVTAMEYLADVISTNYEAGRWKTGSNDDILTGFTDGTMIAAASGLWMQNQLEAVCRNLKAVKLPSFTDDNGKHQMGSFAGTKLYVVNATATQAEQRAAHLIANALTNKDGQLKRFEERNSLPCNKAALEDSAYTQNVDYASKAFNDQAQYAAVQAISAEGRYWPIGEAIGNALKADDTGDYTWGEYLKAQCDSLRAPAA